MQTGPARRGPGWCLRVGVLALALVGAASATGVGHEAHAADQDCAVCQLRAPPAAELSGSPQTGFADAPEPLVPAPAAGWITKGNVLRPDPDYGPDGNNWNAVLQGRVREPAEAAAAIGESPGRPRSSGRRRCSSTSSICTC